MENSTGFYLCPVQVNRVMFAEDRFKMDVAG
jgi:hypothetical protein